MPGVARLGDTCTGHGGWPPRPIVSASSNVFANNTAIARQSDALAAHTNPAIPETHSGTVAGGSATVFVNGLPVARIGDSVACGGSIASGSGNVSAGD